MYRRTFVLALGGLAGLGVSAPMLAVEAARHGLTPGLAEQRAEAPAEEWHAIVREYGYSYQTTAPAELADSLVVDLLGIGHAVDRQRDEAVLRELYRAASLLAALMALTVANLGHPRHAERWWRTARATAERSGSAETAVWVRGREVVRGLYERRPLGAVLRLVEEGERYAVAAPELLAGKAQALALAGRPEEAAAALHTLEGVFEGLPEEVTSDRDTHFAWPEDRLRFTETYVHCHLGDVRRAELARRRAEQLYPAGDRRGPTQLGLLHALALVRAGDVGEGVLLAREVMSGLRPADHVLPTVDLGERVLDAVPPAQRQRTPVTEFRDCLTAFGAPV
jgi:hypothetical protein